MTESLEGAGRKKWWRRNVVAEKHKVTETHGVIETHDVVETRMCGRCKWAETRDGRDVKWVRGEMAVTHE